MPLHIRPASEADGPSVARIYAPYVTDWAASFELEPPRSDEMAQRIVDSSLRHAWLIAEDGKEVVGYAYGATARTRAAYRFTVEVSVYLDLERRGRGMGQALMTELLDVLTKRGYVTAIAGVTLPNDASVRLFERLGFDHVGVYRNIGYKFGRWHDVGWWQRALVEPPPDAPSEIQGPS
ncbi:MAG: N-acetyltransferase family protein [Actinomycetota bacterium]|nr:N-acetyltransferase family protein [Actinomycetota bacterium]